PPEPASFSLEGDRLLGDQRLSGGAFHHSSGFGASAFSLLDAGGWSSSPGVGGCGGKPQPQTRLVVSLYRADRVSGAWFTKAGQKPVTRLTGFQNGTSSSKPGWASTGFTGFSTLFFS